MMRPLTTLAFLAFLAGLAGAAHARGAVTITFTSTQSPTANYAPNNVLAVWVESSTGMYIRTLDVQALARKKYLVGWAAKIGNIANEPDAVSGATRVGYVAATVTWNLQDLTGTIVPDGTYRIRLEQAQSNATSQAANNEGTFTFVKGATTQVQQNLSSGGFTNVTVNFDANAPACGDGIKEASETCDPGIANSCSFTCGVPTDMCMPMVRTGSANQCNIRCVLRPITTCTNFDGCCLASCDGEDTDCDPAAGSGSGSGSGSDDADPESSGGCDAGSSSAFVFALPAFALIPRRRRR